MKVAKFSDIVLIVIVCLALCFPITVKALSKVKVPFPDWLEVGKPSSTLEGRTYARMPVLSFQSVLNGTFQSGVNKYTADIMPARDSVLLANAAGQRVLVRLANAPFGYEAYPTFFGSSVSFCEEGNALWPEMQEDSEIARNKISYFCDQLLRFGERNPNVKVSVFLADYAGVSTANPQSKLVYDPLIQEEVSSIVSSSLGGKVRFWVQSYGPEEYEHAYFKTDFHWNMIGAYAGYREIMNMLELDDLVIPGRVLPCDYPVYEGPLARRGLNLDVRDDVVFDYEFKLPSYNVKTAGKEGGNELLFTMNSTNYSEFAFKSDPTTERYGEAFPARDGGITVIRNDEAHNAGCILVFGDSFARPIDRLLAASYSITILYNPTECKGKTLTDLVNEYRPENVLVLMSVYSVLAHDEYSDAMQ